MKITGRTSIEISDCVRALVQRGELRPGDALPPVRELAEALDVNRNTVAAAYQRLVQAGVAITQGRLGTAISRPPSAGEQEGLSSGTALIDLADGNPNPRWLPDPAALLATRRPKAFLYGEDTILPELCALGEDWFKADCPPARTLELTHGAVDAIERLAAAHLVPGDKVAVEDPCFLGTISALRLAGLRTLGVEIDEAGMRPDALEAALQAGARAVLLTPRVHNPTGCSLTRRRADALKRVLAASPGVLVIVDDHFALLAETPYHSVIPAAAQRWALVRSVSKGFGPDLRVALVACDPDTGERLRTRLAPGMTWVSHILQAIVAAGLESDDVRRQMDEARDDYARRRAMLRAALLAHGIDAPAGGGFNLWIPLPKDARDVGYALAKRGWLVRLGSAFDVQGESRALRVTVSRLEEDLARRFARDLQSCLE
ncbi:transcriptional regulator PtsJ [Pseudothauera nasutitermitis]|uniref:Transcriptional regulator PtsJ n=1 Tax=Pseudothauera nasutitermitis TaxID=2565930 RepID=A0A4S4AZJ4_9RHOO|nr:transcriptional regulator PtsJ [Pseudothauera nasutitermitis]THF65571.1 transcriptional regulator PtsJ [Pseudothauera nasutitermitis]